MKEHLIGKVIFILTSGHASNLITKYKDSAVTKIDIIVVLTNTCQPLHLSTCRKNALVMLQ